MATHPIVTVGDGVITIPEDLLHDPRFQSGARLELVPVTESTGPQAATQDPKTPKGDWRRLRGMFKDLDVNLNEDLNKDRLAELASENRILNGRYTDR